MPDKNQASAIAAIATLLQNYNYEASLQSYDRKIDEWLNQFPLSWIRMALTESLYQGRYKVISVEQILRRWQRRGEPSFHFSREFERLVLNNIPNRLQKRQVSSKSTRKDFQSSDFLANRRYARTHGTSFGPEVSLFMTHGSGMASPAEDTGTQADLDVQDSATLGSSSNQEASDAPRFDKLNFDDLLSFEEIGREEDINQKHEDIEQENISQIQEETEGSSSLALDASCDLDLPSPNIPFEQPTLEQPPTEVD